MGAVSRLTTATGAGVILVRGKYDPVPKYDIAPVLEYLGATLPYSRRGGWQKMRCVFHDDQNPSASVNFLTGRFNCFSCGVNEDAIGLLQHAEGTDFKAAHEEAARISGEGDGPLRGKRSSNRTLFGE